MDADLDTVLYTWERTHASLNREVKKLKCEIHRLQI